MGFQLKTRFLVALQDRFEIIMAKFLLVAEFGCI